MLGLLRRKVLGATYGGSVAGTRRSDDVGLSTSITPDGRTGRQLSHD